MSIMIWHDIMWQELIDRTHDLWPEEALGDIWNMLYQLVLIIVNSVVSKCFSLFNKVKTSCYT